MLLILVAIAEKDATVRFPRTPKKPINRRTKMVRTIVRVWMCVLFCSAAASVTWADGAVYAMTNALGNNQVLVFHRGADGNLTSTPVRDDQYRRRRQRLAIGGRRCARLSR